MKFLVKFLLILTVSSVATLDIDASEKDKKVAPGAVISSSTITALGNSSVTLKDSESPDRNGYILSYAWKQISGTSVEISNANEAVATFTAPNLNTHLDFQLTVTNNDKLTSTKSITIMIEKELILGLSSNQIWQ